MSKPKNDNKQWRADDDRLLVDLVKRHIPIAQICTVLGRTERAIKQRLSDTHHALWSSSGHPESAAVRAPHAIGGMQKNAIQRHEAIMARLEEIDAKVTVLLRALTSTEAQDGEQ